MAKGKKKKRASRSGAPRRCSAAAPVPTETAAASDRLLMTIPEVCDYLAISRATLYRLDLPGRIKVGGQVRFHRPSIDRWILEQID